MVGDRKTLAYEESFNAVCVNITLRRVADDEIEDCYEAVTARLRRLLQAFPLVIASELRGPFFHEQPGNERIMFFEVSLQSPNGACFDAADAIREQNQIGWND